MRGRTLSKYILLHLPEWAIGVVIASLAVSWEWLSWSTAVTLLSVWIAIDLAIYPLLRDAYDAKGPTPAEALIGMEAKAREPLHPSGYVSLRGELWRARLADGGASAPAGATVRVTATEGLTLIVVPAESISQAPTR